MERILLAIQILCDVKTRENMDWLDYYRLGLKGTVNPDFQVPTQKEIIELAKRVLVEELDYFENKFSDINKFAENLQLRIELLEERLNK